jgi:hypothetical protein
MRRLIDYLERALRRASDSFTARVMLLQARRSVAALPLDYRGWVVSLTMVDPEFLVLVAGRGVRSRPEDIGALVGALVRASKGQNDLATPFHVVSPSGRFIVWGWRPDGCALSAGEQNAVLSVVIGRRERASSSMDLN